MGWENIIQLYVISLDYFNPRIWMKVLQVWVRLLFWLFWSVLNNSSQATFDCVTKWIILFLSFSLSLLVQINGLSCFYHYHCEIVGRCFHSRRMLIGFLVTKHQKVRILVKRIKKFPISTFSLSLLLQGQQLKIRSSDHLKQGILGRSRCDVWQFFLRQLFWFSSTIE